MRRRVATLLLSTVVATVGVTGLAAPARATHACDPELSALCWHPEYELQETIDALCDKNVLIDKIFSLLGDCGTS